MSPLSTQDQKLWFQSQMGMESDKQRRRNQRHGYSNPKAGVVGGACLEGTGQAPCSSPHLTDKKIKGSANETTCPRHQLSRDMSVVLTKLSIQGLSHVPSLLLVYTRLLLKLSASQTQQNSSTSSTVIHVHPHPTVSLYCARRETGGS